jgi:hypothetical protein
MAHAGSWHGVGGGLGAFRYLGQGVLRSADGVRTWHRVGGDELANTLVGRLTFDGRGHVFAATSKGLFRRATGGGSTPWTRVLRTIGP